MNLKKVDKEILEILKEAFLTRPIYPMLSDEHLRYWFLRILLFLSLLSIAAKLTLFLAGRDSSSISTIAAGPITLFFGCLFLHINNKSENTSLLVSYPIN